MLLSKSLGLSLASSALGYVLRAEAYDDIELGDWCGTDDTNISPTMLQYYRQPVKRQEQTIVVPTYFHVVSNSTRPEDGYLSVRSSPIHIPTRDTGGPPVVEHTAADARFDSPDGRMSCSKPSWMS